MYIDMLAIITLFVKGYLLETPSFDTKCGTFLKKYYPRLGFFSYFASRFYLIILRIKGRSCNSFQILTAIVFFTNTFLI